MHVYFGEDYVGESQLRLDFVEDTLAISLGPIQHRRSPEARVARRQSGRIHREEGIQSSVCLHREQRKKAPFTQLEDQLPLVKTEEIVIDRVKLTG